MIRFHHTCGEDGFCDCRERWEGEIERLIDERRERDPREDAQREYERDR